MNLNKESQLQSLKKHHRHIYSISHGKDSWMVENL